MNFEFPRCMTTMPTEDELRARYGAHWTVAAGIARRVVRKNLLSESQNHHCCHCGRLTEPDAEEGRRPTTEHVIAQARSGPDTDENVVMACSRCNGLRGNRVIPEEGLVFGDELIEVPPVVLERHRSFDASRAERAGSHRARIEAVAVGQDGICGHCGRPLDGSPVMIGWPEGGVTRYEVVHHACYRARRGVLVDEGVLAPVRRRKAKGEARS